MASIQVSIGAMDDANPSLSPSSSARRNSLAVLSRASSTPPRANIEPLSLSSPSSSSAYDATGEASHPMASYSLGRKTYLPLVTPALDRSEPFFHDHKVGTGNRKPRRTSMPASASHARMDLDDLVREAQRRSRLVQRRDLHIPHDAVSRPLFNAIISNLSNASSPAAASDKAARVAADLIALRRRSALQTSSHSHKAAAAVSQPNSPTPTSAAPASLGAMASSGDSSTATSSSAASQRRASVRSQQLSLLASQARMVSVGSSSVKTAKRAEAVVKGVVRQAVEQRRSSTMAERGLLVCGGGGGGSRSAPVSEPTSPVLSPLTAAAAAAVAAATAGSNPVGEIAADSLRDPTRQWEATLAQPETATAFMEGASELAKDWANGFYAYERSWAGDALRREKRRLSGEDDGSEEEGAAASTTEAGDEEVRKRMRRTKSSEGLRRQSGSDCPVFRDSSSPRAEREAEEEEVSGLKKKTRSVSFKLVVDDDDDDEMGRKNKEEEEEEDKEGEEEEEEEEEEAGEGQQQLDKVAVRSTSTSSADDAKSASAPAGGGLVGVLNEFASLLETRQETCQGLEKLARDARELAGTRLEPVVRVTASAPPELDVARGAKIGEDGDEDDDVDDEEDEEGLQEE
ncbi:hypothetical protein FA10DRAFT_45638 [Acaromyces ingoldii]|uniref:Uncharacterized protein n=1 Tax=Acaromyces ingoldii TaxID=215250 RepID=A0A316YYN9_9BASI|nr:hypothetical protein FA10DRAFT_45638 [Acaromyces ingoldii]PWN94301.1 hypothetical protein FA10DRAFT_45638 [Acaromyces ingoldii]